MMLGLVWSSSTLRTGTRPDIRASTIVLKDDSCAEVVSAQSNSVLKKRLLVSVGSFYVFIFSISSICFL